MIGATLDKYEVLQKIGEGGMASVYRGRHTTLRRDVAIKVLHPHLSSSPRNRRRFAREARAIESLRHENILEILDYSGLETDDCYIVTEFVDGTTLTDLMEQRGRLSSEIATLIGVHLLDGLSYAHSAGVLHRDLKPDNVMIRRDGVVKLMDFGIARFLDESQLTLTGALVGSPAYMSPEQAREDSLDARSDLFSFGTLMFHLVAGSLPFAGGNPSVMLKNIIEGRRPHVTEVAPQISSILADAIERLLSPLPDDRYATAADAAADLRLALSEVEVSDSEGSPWSIAAWMDDPEGYGARLDLHLRRVLLDEGRRRMAAGDAVGALRLLNRLLSIQPDHPEVVAALQGLHQQADARIERRSNAWMGGVALLALSGAALAWWGFVGAAPRPSEVAVDAPPNLPHDATFPSEVSPPPPPPGPDLAAAAPALEVPSEPDLVARRIRSDEAIGGPTQDPARGTPNRVDVAPVRTVESTNPAAVVERPAPDAPAWVELRANLPADIWLGDRRVGNTRQRDPIEVPPGVHEFELRSDLVEPRVVRVIVAPGEHWSGPNVHLEHRPATVHFEPSFPAECVVAIDGVARGTMADIGWSVPLRQPTAVHDVQVSCPGEKPQRQHYSGLTTPEVTMRQEAP